MTTGKIGVSTTDLFPIIKKFLYSDHDIFLREIVSNAVDATQKLKVLASSGEFKDELGELKVRVKADKEAGTLTISDNGIGMTREEVEKYINQIAFSGAEEFLEKHKDDAATIIGHFGLGFYSSFMVSDEVEIVTKSYREGAQAVSYFWGLMTAGCLVGMILLKLIDSKRLLQVSGVLTIVLLLAALFGSKDVSLIAFPAIGFSISMMYSIVFSLALNSASQHHGSFAGILCSAIVGGAGGPMIVSTLADATSLRTGMLSILLFVGYITFIGFWARPLINNKTISLKELLKK